MRTPEEFMQLAFERGRDGIGKVGHRPFACLIVKDGNIVGEAVSTSKSGNDPTAHGEVLAIRDACQRLDTRDLKGCDLYTTCEPCPLCVSAIWYAKVSRVYYSYTLEDCERIGIGTRELIEELQHSIQDRKLPSRQLLVDEGRKLFNDWRRAPNFMP
jgi:guanine deaminase